MIDQMQIIIALILYRLTTTGSEDVMRMSLANNEDPDD